MAQQHRRAGRSAFLACSQAWGCSPWQADISCRFAWAGKARMKPDHLRHQGDKVSLTGPLAMAVSIATIVRRPASQLALVQHGVHLCENAARDGRVRRGFMSSSGLCPCVCAAAAQASTIPKPAAWQHWSSMAADGRLSASRMQLSNSLGAGILDPAPCIALRHPFLGPSFIRALSRRKQLGHRHSLQRLELPGTGVCPCLQLLSSGASAHGAEREEQDTP